MSVALDPSFWGSGPFVQRRLSPWVVVPPSDSHVVQREWAVAAEPDPYEICEQGLRLLCLAVIKQARLDARRKSYQQKAPAVQFLQIRRAGPARAVGRNGR